MPVIGPMSALAVEAFTPPMGSFRHGRDFAAWLGLVPKQHSSGGKERLERISKAGQADIRRLLIMGAMSRLNWLGRKTIPKEKAKGFVRRLTEALSGNHSVSTVDMISSLNRQLVGWAAYYKFTDFTAYVFQSGYAERSIAQETKPGKTCSTTSRCSTTRSANMSETDAVARRVRKAAENVTRGCLRNAGLFIPFGMVTVRR